LTANLATATDARPLARDSARSWALAILAALATGAGMALAKRYLDFHLGIPGHAGVGWIAVLVAGSTMNRRPGTALIAGASVGLWGLPLGLGHSMGYNMALYGTAAGALEGMRLLPGLRLSHPFAAIAGGFAVHLAKFGFVIGYLGVIGMVRHVHVFGVMPALFNHAVFGIAGGLLGWLAYRAATRASRRAGHRHAP
jgi:hypothetical protein